MFLLGFNGWITNGCTESRVVFYILTQPDHMYQGDVYIVKTISNLTDYIWQQSGCFYANVLHLGDVQAVLSIPASIINVRKRVEKRKKLTTG